MTKTLFALPALALLAACTPDAPPAPRVAAGPEEQFRGVCEQRFPNAAPFGVTRCMFEELDRSRGVQPAAATDSPAPAASTPRSTPRSSTRSRAR